MANIPEVVRADLSDFHNEYQRIVNEAARKVAAAHSWLNVSDFLILMMASDEDKETLSVVQEAVAGTRQGLRYVLTEETEAKPRGHLLYTGPYQGHGEAVAYDEATLAGRLERPRNSQHYIGRLCIVSRYLQMNDDNRPSITTADGLEHPQLAFMLRHAGDSRPNSPTITRTRVHFSVGSAFRAHLWENYTDKVNGLFIDQVNAAFGPPASAPLA